MKHGTISKRVRYSIIIVAFWVNVLKSCLSQEMFGHAHVGFAVTPISLSWINASHLDTRMRLISSTKPPNFGKLSKIENLVNVLPGSRFPFPACPPATKLLCGVLSCRDADLAQGAGREPRLDPNQRPGFKHRAIRKNCSLGFAKHPSFCV